MANYKVYGADRQSGEQVAQIIAAESAQEAERIAQERGLMVSHVELESEPEARFDDEPIPSALEPTAAPPAEPEPEPEAPETSPGEAQPPQPDDAHADESVLYELTVGQPDPTGAQRDEEPEPEPEPESESEPETVLLPEAHAPEQRPESPEDPDVSNVSGAAAAAAAAAAGEPEAEPEAESEAESQGEWEDGPLDIDADAETASAPPPPVVPPAPPPAKPIDVTGPSDRRGTAWLAYLRISVGLMWVYKLTLGTGPGLRLDDQAQGWDVGGSEVTSALFTPEAPGWMAWLIETCLLPHAGAWNTGLLVLEVVIALSLILGVLVRPVALLAVVYSFVLLNLGDIRLGPFFAVAHLMMLATGGGRILGFDSMLADHLRQHPGRAAQSVAAVIEGAVLARGLKLALAGAALVAALYYLLRLAEIETWIVRVAHIDVAVWLALVSLALLVTAGAFRGGGAVSDLVRLFLGFKLLHTSFMHPSVSIGALRGWGDDQAIVTALERIATEHWAPIGGFIEQAVLPHVSYWIAAVAALQVIAGVLLVLGWWSRLAAALGLLTMLGLTLGGFVALAPFGLIYAIYLIGAGGGRMLAIDAALTQASERARPCAWPRWAAVITGVLAVGLVLFVGYAWSAEHTQPLAGTVALLLAIPLVALTLIAWPRPAGR